MMVWKLVPSFSALTSFFFEPFGSTLFGYFRQNCSNQSAGKPRETYRGRFPGMARSAGLDGGEVSPLQSGRADAAGLENGTACEWLIAVGSEVLKNLSRCPAVASLSRSKKPATTSRSF